MNNETAPQNPPRNRLLLIIAHLFFAPLIALFFSLGTYFLLHSKLTQSCQKQLKAIREEVIGPSVDVSFLKKITKAYSFSNSKNENKKIVAVYEKDSVPLEEEIYLTDDIFSRSSAIKISSVDATCCEVINIYISDTEKKLLVIEIAGPGGNRYILADEDGNVISNSVIQDNASKIGLGTVIKGQLWVSSARFLYNRKGTFFVNIVGSGGQEEYTVEIDGFTGEYIEGSRRKIK